MNMEQKWHQKQNFVCAFSHEISPATRDNPGFRKARFGIVEEGSYHQYLAQYVESGLEVTNSMYK
jgi:hypothetical protein